MSVPDVDIDVLLGSQGHDVVVGVAEVDKEEEAEEEDGEDDLKREDTCRGEGKWEGGKKSW